MQPIGPSGMWEAGEVGEAATCRETVENGGDVEHTSNDVLLTQTLCFIMNISCCSGRNVTNSAQPRKKFSRRRCSVAHSQLKH